MSQDGEVGCNSSGVALVDAVPDVEQSASCGRILAGLFGVLGDCEEQTIRLERVVLADRLSK